MTMASMKMGSKANYVKIEEALRTSSLSDLESGVTLASQAIEQHESDGKLYLLRAKLSFKILVIKKFLGKIDEQIKNCVGDCDQAIAIVERGTALLGGEITRVKVEALQLGCACCDQLNDEQKHGEMEHRLLEMGIAKLNLEQIKFEFLFLMQDQQYDETRTYNLKEMLFPKMSYIEQPLLDDVIRCYKDRQTVCRNCFYNDRRLHRGYDAKGKCTQCKWDFKKLLVIPKSPLTVNYYKGSDMIAIPPWPKSKPNDLPFESCAKSSDRSHDHKRCLIMSRNSDVWYAHTVEELVIWTVEREYGCSFEEFIRDREPLQPTLAAAAPSYQMYNPGAGMYLATTIATSQAGSYPMYSYPYPYQPLPTTAIPLIPCTEAYVSPNTYPFTQAIVPLAAQLQTEDMFQQFNCMAFSSPPTSPQVTADNQKPVASTKAVTKDK